MSDNVVPIRPKGGRFASCSCGDTKLRVTSAFGGSMSAACPNCGDTVTARPTEGDDE